MIAAINDTALTKLNREEFSGRMINNLYSYLTWAKYLPKEVLDDILDYAMKDYEQLSPEILAKVVILFFHLGYAPSKLYSYLPAVTEILSR